MGPPPPKVSGHHYYVQDQSVDLKSIFSALPTEARYVHIYCDTLKWDGPLTILPDSGGTVRFPAPNLRYIHIYARSFLENLNASTVIKFGVFAANNVDRNFFRFAIFFDICPKGLAIGHVGTAGEQNGFAVPIERPPGSSCAGIFVSRPVEANMTVATQPGFNRLRWNYEIPQVPALELAPDQSGSSGLQASTELLRCLKNMFQEASTQILTNDQSSQAKAISMLRFIVLCTRTSTRYGALCKSAQAVLAPLELPQKSFASPPFSSATQRFEVPVFKTEAYFNLIKNYVAYLTGLESSEASLKILESATAIQQTQIDSTKRILNSVALTATSFTDNTENRKDAFSALATAVKMESDMLSQLGWVKIAQAKLEKDGLDVWQGKLKEAEDKRQLNATLNAVKSGLKAVAGIFEGDFTGIIETYQFVTEQIDKDDRAVKTAEKFQTAARLLVHRIPALVQDMSKVSTTFKDLKPNLNALDTGTLSPTETEALFARIAAAPPVDSFAIRNKLEDFKVDITSGFTAFREAVANVAQVQEDETLKDIPGVSAYEDELMKLAIRGATAIDAQVKASDTFTVYVRGMAETKARQEVQNKIKEMADDAATVKDVNDAKAKWKATLAVLQREIELVKIPLFTQFFRGLLSYTFRTSSLSWPKDEDFKINGSSSATAYTKAMLSLQNNLLTKEVKMKGEVDVDDPLIASTDDPNSTVFPKEWKKQLYLDGTVHFQIPPGHPGLKDWYHYRIRSMYAKFTYGPSAPMTPKFDYKIEVGPNFLDKTESGQLLHFVIDPWSQQRSNTIPENDQLKVVWTDEAQKLYINPVASCTGLLDFHTKDEAIYRQITNITLKFTFKAVNVWKK